MKLSANYSDALLALVKAGEVNIDAIEVVDKVSLEKINTIQNALPEMPVHYHHGRLKTSPPEITKLSQYLAACPMSPYLSAHLAPVPYINTLFAMRWKLYLPILSRPGCIRRFTRTIEWFCSLYNREVLLENMQPLPFSSFDFESEPQLITQILACTNAHFLLDLAHARMAAQVRRITPQQYISKLPLHLIAQIHISGVRSANGNLYDAHQSLEAEDYRLLEWTLNKVSPAWLTLEYHREDLDQVWQQLTMLRRFL